MEQALSRQLAPEAVLSRLSRAGLDVDRELRQMLGGGSPNAIHAMAAETLGEGSAVWTTNFDELIEAAARTAAVEFHRRLPGDSPDCDCGLGHLVKMHGTLSGERVLARSEDVLVPLAQPWLKRLAADLRGVEVAIVGYAGADIDLRTGLRDALRLAAKAVWFGTERDRDPLRRRFANVLATGRLQLMISSRPDWAAFDWGSRRGLVGSIPDELITQLYDPAPPPKAHAQYEPNHLLRARVLDDIGDGGEGHAGGARREYRRALLVGPRRRVAAGALYSSGMIHGARWRAAVVPCLSVLCALPVRWSWPHRQRLPYLTWNVLPDRRLPILDRSLATLGYEAAIMMAAANAAKEVDPRRAVQLGLQAQKDAIARRDPADVAWATFVLSLALRWRGDLAAAAEQAARLADGYDALAGPTWVAWGHFEVGAVMALRGELPDAQRQMQLAVEVFTAAGSIFTFDAWCGMIAICRAAGDSVGQRTAYDEARRLVERGSLRRRFKRDVLMVEDAEDARARSDLDEAERLYGSLSRSRTIAQELLGWLGLGEVQRQRGERPEASWTALRRSRAVGFGYGEVHAAVTLGLAGEITEEAAEEQIAHSVYVPPVRDDVAGLGRYCQGRDPTAHVLCFP